MQSVSLWHGLPSFGDSSLHWSGVLKGCRQLFPTHLIPPGQHLPPQAKSVLSKQQSELLALAQNLSNGKMSPTVVQHVFPQRLPLGQQVPFIQLSVGLQHFFPHFWAEGQHLLNAESTQTCDSGQQLLPQAMPSQHPEGCIHDSESSQQASPHFLGHSGGGLRALRSAAGVGILAFGTGVGSWKPRRLGGYLASRPAMSTSTAGLGDPETVEKRKKLASKRRRSAPEGAIMERSLKSCIIVSGIA